MDLDSQKNGAITGQPNKSSGTTQTGASQTSMEKSAVSRPDEPSAGVTSAIPDRHTRPQERAECDVTDVTVRDILSAHLSRDAAEHSLQRWVAMSGNYPSQDALFNAIVEFTREIAKTERLDTIAKQNIRSGMFQRLLRHRL